VFLVPRAPEQRSPSSGACKWTVPHYSMRPQLYDRDKGVKILEPALRLSGSGAMKSTFGRDPAQAVIPKRKSGFRSTMCSVRHELFRKWNTTAKSLRNTYFYYDFTDAEYVPRSTAGSVLFLCHTYSTSLVSRMSKCPGL